MKQFHLLHRIIKFLSYYLALRIARGLTELNMVIKHGSEVDICRFHAKIVVHKENFELENNPYKACIFVFCVFN